MHHSLPTSPPSFPPRMLARILLLLLLANSTSLEPGDSIIEMNMDSLLQKHLKLDPARMSTLTIALATTLASNPNHPDIPPECSSSDCLMRALYSLIHVSVSKSKLLPFGPVWQTGAVDADPRRSSSRSSIPSWIDDDYLELVAGGVKTAELLVIERHQIAHFMKYVGTEPTLLTDFPVGFCMEFDDTHLLSAFFRSQCYGVNRYGENAHAENAQVYRHTDVNHVKMNDVFNQGLHPVVAVYEPKYSLGGVYLLEDASLLREGETLEETIELRFDLLNVTTTVPRAVVSLFVVNQVLEHVANPFVAAKSIYDLLVPGGYFVSSTPFHSPK